MRLGTSISHVEYDDELKKWRLEVSKDGKNESLIYSKVVVCTGPHNIPIQPEIPGSKLFEGDMMHSVRFKGPTKFAGKNVVVVGMANTAVDTATGLIGHARKVYLAHRGGCALLPAYLERRNFPGSRRLIPYVRHTRRPRDSVSAVGSELRGQLGSCDTKEVRR